jgi:S-adenosylhomocysteine hydrolase
VIIGCHWGGLSPLRVQSPTTINPPELHSTIQQGIRVFVLASGTDVSRAVEMRGCGHAVMRVSAAATAFARGNLYMTKMKVKESVTKEEEEKENTAQHSYGNSVCKIS